MIIIDSQVVKNSSIKALLRMIEKDLPSKVAICGELDIDDYFKEQLDNSGVSFIHGKNSFAIIAGLHKISKENGDLNIKVFSENPMTLSLLSNDKTEVISPSNRKSHSVSDVERAMRVKPEKVIDFLYIFGSQNAKTNQWLPVDRDTVSTWLEHSNIVKLVRDEHSPAKSHSMFESRLERGIDALNSRQKLFHEIKALNVNFGNLEVCHSIPQDLTISDKEENKDTVFSIEKLSEIIDYGKSTGSSISIFIKENKSPSFLAGFSDRIEALVTDEKGRSVLINNSINDSLNKSALSLLSKEIEEGLLVCTNNAKDLFKVTCLRSKKPVLLSHCHNVHDVNVMAFSLDNRNKKISLNKLHSLFKTNDIGNQGLALISLFNRLMYHFEKPGNEFNYKAYLEQEKPLVPILARMEVQGVRLNKSKLDGFTLRLTKKINGIVKEMRGMAFDGFSPEKTDHVSRMLYDVLKLPVVGLTQNKNKSTDAKVLEKLSGKHPFVQLMIDFRKYNDLRNKANGFLNHQNPYSKKIHCTFEQTSSQNGRLSTVEPNIQGIPSKSEDANEIKRSFDSDPDDVFISLDYKQAEVFILACLSGDSRLQNVVLSGEDIHSVTASQIFDCEISKVTDEQRRAAKAINFGIVYGMSHVGLSRDLGISESKAQKFIDKYFETYPGVKSYLDFLKEGASQTGFVLTGSRKRIYIDSNNKGVNLRSAVNAPMQGTAAEIIKKAMIKTYDALISKGLNAELCIQVHDELVISAKKSEAEEVKSIVSEIMTKETGLSIPLKVDIEIKTSLSKLDIVNDGYDDAVDVPSSKNKDLQSNMSLKTA